MKINNIYPTRNYIKSLRHLPKNIQKLAVEKEKIFKANPHDARLKTHELRGDLNGHWAYSLNYQYRVLFKFIENNDVIYYDIGTHEIYR